MTQKKDGIPATLEKLAVPIDGLKPYGKNPRRGDVGAIAESLETHGQYKPIVVRSGTNEVLAGNHTLKAAKELGWERIAVTFVDVDDDTAARIVLVDNRTNDLAGYDEAELTALLDSLPDLRGTGFTVDAHEALVHGLEQEPAEPSDTADEIPATQPEPIARPGDIFVLGDHRVICGDATDPATLAALMGGEVAHMMWTDPPYGVDYVGKTKEALEIQNDGRDGLEALLTDALLQAKEHLRPGAPVYMAYADTNRRVFEDAVLRAGYIFRQNLIWVKNTMILGRSDYHYRHEPIMNLETPPDPSPAEEGPAGGDPGSGKTHDGILYGFTPGGVGRLGRGGPKWYGTNNRTSVFEVDKPAASREHPTMKPVKLILEMLANSARPGHLILDPFAGSGSTLIAAHTHGAIARCVELEPRYVDVICARYQKETGELPRRGGEAIDFIREGS